MEFAKVLKQLKKNSGLILTSSLLVGFLLSGFSQLMYPHYVSALQIYVYKDSKEAPSGDYSYDGYYAQQFAEAYTDTVVGFLESKDTVALALQQSDKDLSLLRKYTRSIAVEKIAPQLVQVEVSWKDEETSREFVKSLASAALERIQTVNAGKDDQVMVELVAADPLIQHRTIPFPLDAITGLLLGALFGVSWVLYKAYLDEQA